MNKAKAYRLAFQEAKRRFPSIPDEELDEEVNRILDDWTIEAAQDREMFGDLDDSRCLENGRDNCDDYGTGEGRYHGRI